MIYTYMKIWRKQIHYMVLCDLVTQQIATQISSLYTDHKQIELTYDGLMLVVE